MTRFVQLTLDGEPIFVNVAQVMTVEPLESGSRVSMSVYPGSFDVGEDYEKVTGLLIMATEVAP